MKCVYCGTEEDVRPFIKETRYMKEQTYACIECGVKKIKRIVFIQGFLWAALIFIPFCLVFGIIIGYFC